MERTEASFQSRGQILDFFQAVSGYNFDDTIRFLNECEWDVDRAVRKLFPEDHRKTTENDLSTPALVEKNDRLLAEHFQRAGEFPTTDGNVLQTITMCQTKRIGVAAHNDKKEELVKCLKKHRDILTKHRIYGTGTTGSLVERELNISVTKFESGPLGGDQQLGAKITSRQLDILIFFIDPLNSHAHEADVTALVRLAQVYGIVCITTTATADFVLTSELMDLEHIRDVKLQAYKPK